MLECEFKDSGFFFYVIISTEERHFRLVFVDWYINVRWLAIRFCFACETEGVRLGISRLFEDLPCFCPSLLLARPRVSFFWFRVWCMVAGACSKASTLSIIYRLKPTLVVQSGPHVSSVAVWRSREKILWTFCWRC